MGWLRTQWSRGIFGAGWFNAGVCVALAAGVFVTSKIYVLLNHGPNVLFLRTPLDDAIPVVPLFIIPYVSLEPFIYGTLLLWLIFRLRTFQSAALAMILTWFVCYAFYFFLQTVVVRPLLPDQDPFTQMIRDVYAGDNPFNDFPSLHTALSTVLAIYWWRVDRRAGWIAALWATLIVLSTVFIKQHYVPDLAAGLVVAGAAATVFRDTEAALPAAIQSE